ncbi:MAG TPA: RagB/SusD family nutrient uptake outer membrane protein [Ohtaekwangia sp.]|nr:RagB/SusD family nutrient uptake outer membrane protein [Ohtaekwangia sp.]
MKIKNIVYAGFFLLLVTNCDDFIEEENKSNIAADGYYKTSAGYESLVNSTYATLRTVYDLPWVFEAGTDMYTEGRSDNQPESLSEYRNLTPADPNVAAFYAACYQAIQRCNIALYYNGITEQTDVTAQRKAEVQFLRAYYYFLLVQSFGDVALVTERFEAPVLSFTRNSAEEVYAFIIDEMQQALQVLDPVTTTPFGRVNARAIRHYLAKVHLTRGYESFAAGDDYEKAAAYADAAINGQALTISFHDLFWPGNENNAEVLFSIQYDKSSILNPQSDGSNQNAFFGPYMGGEGAARGYPYRQYTLVPTMYVFDLFNEHDARFEGTFMVTFYERYYDFYDKAGSLESLNVWYYYAPSWVDVDAWKAEDPLHREDAIIIPYGPAWEGNTNSQDRATPAVRKFDDPASLFTGNINGNSSRDIFLARLGETYLIAAEAYLQDGDPTTATARINEVRRRADISGTDALQIAEGELDIDFILDERARELVGEYHRWFDLKRTGKLVERNNLYNTPLRQKYFMNGIDAFEGPDGNQKILRPIPQAALDLNQADVTQNPGY